MPNSPYIYGPNGIAKNLLPSTINSDNTFNKFDGVYNCIANGHFQVDTTGWAVWGLSAYPFTGTGGTGTTGTISTQTTTIIEGVQSAVLASGTGASGTQFQGWSYDFTIPNSLKAKAITISFMYQLISGSYTPAQTNTGNSDLGLWMYDITNATLTQVSRTINDVVTTVTGSTSVQYQTASNSNNYRLILAYFPTAAGTIMNLALGKVFFGPSVYNKGFAASDLVAAGTITIGATTTAPTKGTVSTDVISWGRMGDHAHVTGEYKQTAAGSSAGTGDYLFTLPNGMSFDTSKVSLYTTVNTTNTPWPAQTSLGSATISQGGTGVGSSTGIGVVLPYSATQFRIGIVAVTSNGSNGYQTGIMGTYLGYFTLTTAALSLSFDFLAPILGWSSNVAMSADSDTRVTVARYYTTSTAAITTNAVVNFETPSFDSHGAVTAGASWNYKVQSPGYMKVSTFIQTSSFSAGSTWQVFVYKNGIPYAVIDENDVASGARGRLRGSTLVACNANDLLDLRISFGAGAPTFNSGETAGTANWVTFERVTGPSAIAATETIAASYYMSAAFTSSTTIPMNFDSKEYDTHGAVTTSSTAWKFTAPAAGLYAVSGGMNTNGTAAGLVLYKNGVSYKTAGAIGSAGSASARIRLIAGDYIDLRTSSSQNMSGGALGTYPTSNISVERIGL